MKLLGMGTNPTNITTTPTALAVNTYPTYAKSFELQGKSLVLNQHIYQIYNTIDPSLTGLTVTFNNGLLSVSGTADVTVSIKLLDNNDLVANHKYYFNAPAGSSTAGYRPYFSTSGDSYTTDSIITWTTGKGSFNIRVNGGTSTGFSYYPQFIDLTQMFGPGLEPTTVDQLKAIIDIDKYIPYNPGTFIHNNATYEVNKWNQLVKNGNFESLSQWVTGGEGYTINNNTVTFTAASQNSSLRQTSWTITNGHKYLVYGEMKLTTGTTSVRTCIYDGSSVLGVSTANTTDWQVVAGILTATNSTTSGQFQFIRDGRSSGWDTIQGRNAMCIDLTDIFGAGKEPSTVDECKLRFLAMGIDVAKYQPYFPLSSQYCGYRNIWDEEWELGDFNSTTGVKESGSRIINTDYIPVLSNTNYYVNNTNVITVYYYDSNKVFLGYNNPSSGCFEILPNSAYINFRCSTTYGTTYKNDISIYQVSNRVDLGFNIWDEEVESGYIDPSGIPQTHSTSLRSKNYCQCVGGYVYYAKQPTSFANATAIAWYKSDKTFLSRNFVNNEAVTAPADAMFFKVSLYNYGTTYNHDICINESQPDTTKSPHNGDYRPYLMLRGIGSDFNVWDETIESGEYNATTGEKQAAVDYLRSVNKTRVLPSTTYYLKCPLAVSAYYYDVNGTKIGTNSPTLSANSTFTTVAGAYYMTFAFNKNNYGSTTYKNDICINLSQPQTTINPHNGQYIPHLFDTYDSMSGILTRRIGVVDLGTLSWNIWGSTSSYDRYVTEGIDTLVPSNAHVLCTMFASKQSSESIAPNMVWVSSGSAKLSIATTVGAYTDASTFKAAMNGVMLLYELNAYQVFTPIQYSVVDLGSLSWVYNSTYGNFYTTGLATTIKRPAASNIIPNVKCSKYSAATQNNYSTNNTIKVITNGQVWIKDTSYGTDASAFKTGVTGVMLTYQNNTPYKFGVVDMGSLNWSYNSTYNVFYAYPSNLPTGVQNQSYYLQCSGYNTINCVGFAGLSNKDCTIISTTQAFCVKDDSYTSASDFTNAVKGMILTYELSDSISQTTITQPISFVAGKLGKQYGVVDLGSLSWSYDPDEGDKFFFSNELSTMQQNTPNVLCAAYRTNNSPTSAGRLGHMEMKVFGLRVYLKNILYTNTTAFKNTLHGQYLIYELADNATNPTYATAGNLIRKTNGNVGDVDFNLNYWEESQVKLVKVGNKFLAVNE